MHPRRIEQHQIRAAIAVEIRRDDLPVRIPLTRRRVIERAEPGLAERLDPDASHAVIEQEIVAPGRRSDPPCRGSTRDPSGRRCIP